MRLPALCALALLVAQPAAAQPRHGGVFAYSGTEAGCRTIYATTRQVQAYAEARAVGTPVRQIEAGRRIDINDRSEEIIVVLAPGRLVARRNVTIDEWSYYDSDRPARGALRIPRGTVVETLGTGGDNSVIWRMGGVVYGGLGMVPAAEWMVDEHTRQNFSTESFPQTEHWVRLVARAGRPAAWLNVSQPGVSETGQAGEYCE